MRPDLIYGGAVAAGATIQYRSEKGHTNGVLFFSKDPISGAKITAKRNTPGGKCEVLAANLPIEHVQRISDYKHGTGARQTEMSALRQLLTTDHDGAGAGVPVFTSAQFKQHVIDVLGPQDFGAFFLDLGSIYNGPASSLELSIQFPNAGEVYLYSVSHTRTPDRMVQYDVLTQNEEHLVGVQAVYMAAKTGQTLLTVDADGLVTGAMDVTIQTEDRIDGGTLADVRGFVAAAAVLARQEASMQSGLVPVFQSIDNVPADVYVKASGADSGNVQLIVARWVFHAPTVTANTSEELRKHTERVASIEARDPETAKALRHAGLANKSSDLRSVLATAEKA